jgi:cathepsin L
MRVSALFAAAAARSFSDYTFEAYQAEHGKQYTAAEEAQRREIFERSLARVQQHNDEYQAGRHTWWMTMNHLADRTPEELKRMRGHKKGQTSGVPTANLQAQANPTSVDWRTKNVLTPVKNQGQCGSCWAFASTETVEAHYAIASGKLVELAPQTYVSCMKNPDSCGGTGGCEGAIAELAFNYTAAHGLAAAADYPYTASDTACKAYTPAVKVGGYVKLPENDASALETALATVGPIAVSVAAEQWSLYGGGIFTGCTGSSGTDVDHAVQAVGYSADYWIIRNSWGPSWGEGGFIRLSRSKDSTMQTDATPADGYACKPYPSSLQIAGECGVLSDSAYPTGASSAMDVVV